MVAYRLLQFRKLGYEVVDMICDYMTTSKNARVLPDVKVCLNLLYRCADRITPRLDHCA